MTESPAIHSPMSEEHEKHLAGIINDLARDVSKKYRKGQKHDQAKGYVHSEQYVGSDVHY